MNQTQHAQMIDQFEAHYKYDSTYMREMLTHSPTAFDKFNQALPLARHRELLDVQDYWIAKLSAMQVEDCGECLQLNVRMALEAGLDKATIQGVLFDDSTLSPALQDIKHYAAQVTSQGQVAAELMQRMQQRYATGELLEFGLCIASAKLFPTIKRALGNIHSCQLVQIEL